MFMYNMYILPKILWTVFMRNPAELSVFALPGWSSFP